MQTGFLASEETLVAESCGSGTMVCECCGETVEEGELDFSVLACYPDPNCIPKRVTCEPEGQCLPGPCMPGTVCYPTVCIPLK